MIFTVLFYQTTEELEIKIIPEHYSDVLQL